MIEFLNKTLIFISFLGFLLFIATPLFFGLIPHIYGVVGILIWAIFNIINEDYFDLE